MPLLTHLDLSHNHFVGAVPDLRGCGSLRDLNLERNAFDGPLPALGSCPQLRRIAVAHNRLSGAIPEDVAQLTQRTTEEHDGRRGKKSVY